MAKSFVVFKTKKQKHPTYTNMYGYECIEVDESDSMVYATDFASKNPGVECWIVDPKTVVQIAPGPMTIRAYNSKGELLPV